MFIRERKRSQEANCFPKCRFKRLSNGSVIAMSVFPVVQSTRARGCWPTHLSVLQLPRHSPVPARRTGGGNRSGWEKSMLKQPPKSNMFFFPARIASPIWPGAQLHKQLRRGGGGAGRQRPWKGNSAAASARTGPRKGPSTVGIRLPRSPPAPSSTAAASWLSPGGDGCSDTRGKRGHSHWFAPRNSSWKRRRMLILLNSRVQWVLFQVWN